MSCSTQAPHNIYIVDLDFLCYGNYPPARRQFIAAEPACVPGYLNSESIWFPSFSGGIMKSTMTSELCLHCSPCYPFQGNPSAVWITSTAELCSRKVDSSLAPGSSQAGECKWVHLPNVALLTTLPNMLARYREYNSTCTSTLIDRMYFVSLYRIIECFVSSRKRNINTCNDYEYNHVWKHRQCNEKSEFHFTLIMIIFAIW